MDKRMYGMLLGILLIIIALILAVVQHYNIYNFYGDVSNKWYFWGFAVVLGIIGLIVAAWEYMKKPAPAQ
ncbi:hypothetical protein HXY33_06660 [Candidatus Bathyarchaeota archaeon]|nr:hypothetical protein [Candidatus Bathyarchaeota archaeon]